MHENVSCKCVIVGDGPLRKQLLRQMVELKLTDRIFFVSFQQKTRPYLEAANAFLLSSEREGLPLALIEAMSFRLPSVVTNVGGNAEAITDKVQGLVVPSVPVGFGNFVSYYSSR